MGCCTCNSNADNKFLLISFCQKLSVSMFLCPCGFWLPGGSLLTVTTWYPWSGPVMVILRGWGWVSVWWMKASPSAGLHQRLLGHCGCDTSRKICESVHCTNSCISSAMNHDCYSVLLQQNNCPGEGTNNIMSVCLKQGVDDSVWNKNNNHTRWAQDEKKSPTEVWFT